MAAAVVAAPGWFDMATKTQFTFLPIGGRQVLEPRVWNETQTYIEDAIDELVDAVFEGSGVIVATQTLQEIAGDNVTQDHSIVDSVTVPGALPRARMLFGTTVGGSNSNSYISFWTNQDGLSRLERLRIQPNGLVTFGGITSGHPALKRNSAKLEVRLGDDSALATLNVGAYELNGAPLSNTFLTIGGGDITGQLIITIAAATAPIVMRANGGSGLINERYSSDANGVEWLGRKSRGSFGAETNVAQNDVLSRWIAQGLGDGAFRNGGHINFIVTEPTPAVGAMGSAFRVHASQLGTTNVALAMTLDHANGLDLFGNVVINPSSHLQMRSYTIATLPSPSPSGQVINCSDTGGGPSMLVSDGTGWRRTTPSYQQIIVDADITLTTLTHAENHRQNTTLTANRVVTLGTTNARQGARFIIRRNGLGAFTLTIDNHDGTDLFVFPSATQGTAMFVYNGTDWIFMGNWN